MGPWLLLACAVVLVLLIIAAIRSQDSARSTLLRVLVNATALVTLGLATVVGVQLAQPDEDVSSCAAPSAIDDPAEGDRAARQADRQKRDEAQQDLESSRALNQVNPSVSTAREVRRAAQKVSRIERRLKTWRPVGATVAETTTTVFALGYDRNPGVRSLAFTLDKRVPGPRLIQVNATPFVAAAAGKEIAPTAVVSWAVLEPDSRRGTLYFCVPSDRRMGLPSGEFTGSLVVDDVRLASLAPEITLTVAYSNVARVMLIGLAIAFAASWYVFFLRRDQLSDVVLLGHVHTPPEAAAESNPPTEEELRAREEATRVLRWPFGFWWGYWRWVTSASGVITIVAGMAAAVTAFSTAYLSSETWTGSFGDWFAYCGAVATAFVAGGTAGKLAQIADPGSERKNRFRAQPADRPANPPDVAAEGQMQQKAPRRPAQPSWIRNRRR